MVPSTSSGTEGPVVEPVETTDSTSTDPGVPPVVELVETTISNCSLHLFLIIVRIINPFHKQLAVVDLVGKGSGQQLTDESAVGGP